MWLSRVNFVFSQCVAHRASAMHPQYAAYISDLSTDDLIQIIRKNQYAILAETIRQFNITGKDLLALKECDLILKFKNNVNRRQFQAFLNHVQTTPQELFTIGKPVVKPLVKPKPATTIQRSASNVSSELDAIFAKRKQQRAELSEETQTKIEPNQFKRLDLSRTGFKTVVSKNPQGESKHEPKQLTRRFSSVTQESTNLPKYINATTSLPRPHLSRVDPARQSAAKPATVGYAQRPNYLNNERSPIGRNAYEETQRLNSNTAHFAEEHQLQNKNQRSRNVQGHSDAPAEDLPEYINTLTSRPMPDREPHVAHQQHQKPTPEGPDAEPKHDHVNNDLPEYINTGSNRNVHEEHQEAEPSENVHILDDPKARQELEAKLKNALKEFERGKHYNQEQPVYSNPEEAEEEEEEEDRDIDTPDSFDSFSEPEEESPPSARNIPLIPPSLPERPPGIFKASVVRQIKPRDSSSQSDNPRNSNSGQLAETLRTPSVKKEEKTAKNSNIYGKLPTVRLREPVLPPEEQPIPDDNEYVRPVTLNSPQYVIRRIRFFREVTRHEGMNILANKPVGTFLLRPSKAYLAVLMFLGSTMMYHVPICYDDHTDEYFLAAQPGAINPNKFKNMLNLLNYYSRFPIDEGGEMILDPEENNID